MPPVHMYWHGGRNASEQPRPTLLFAHLVVLVGLARLADAEYSFQAWSDTTLLVAVASDGRCIRAGIRTGARVSRC